MKALSLTQPGASLMYDGRKTIETRSWAPPLSLMGERFAIHAARSIMRGQCFKFGYEPERIPRGALLCTVELIGCLRTPFRPGAIELLLGRPPFIEERLNEWDFGNFEDGRYAWFTRDVQKFAAPIPAIGRLGLWECGPLEVLLELAAAVAAGKVPPSDEGAKEAEKK